MYKGSTLAYTVIAVSYWTVAFMGYAVFGNTVNPYLVNSFFGPDWLITLANIFAIIQVLGCYQVQPGTSLPPNESYLFIQIHLFLSIYNCIDFA